jgi:hypothetical protein
MRKISAITIFILLILMSFTMIPANVSAQEVCPYGMVSYWKFEEGSGNLVGDSANGNDGVLNPIGPIWTTGKVGDALSFDGMDDSVIVSDDESLDIQNQLSIETWIKTTEKDKLQNIVAKFTYSTGTDNSGYKLNVHGGLGNTAQIAIGNNDYDYVVGTSDIADGQFHHVVGTYSNGILKIYVDGVLEGTTTGAASSIRTNNRPLSIGSREYGNIYDTNRFFKGTIDEVRIYSRALTGTEVQEHNVGIFKDETALEGLWHFDEGLGNIATDSSLKNNDGTLNPLAPTWINGQVEGALNFDGTDDSIIVSDDESLDIQNQLSIEAWIKTTEKDKLQNIVAKFTYSTGTDNSGYKLAVHSGLGNTAQIAIGNNDYDYVVGTSDIVDGQFHHVVGTYSNGILKIYVDGVLEGTTTGAASSIRTNNRPLSIGSREYGNIYDTNRFFKGTIDEVAIWNKELSIDEILLHYTNGLIGKNYCYVPPDQAIQNLFDDIQDLQDLPEGTENNLLSKLDSALDCIESGNDNAASNILNAFINAVEAQSGKKFTIEQANDLIAAAQKILTTI